MVDELTCNSFNHQDNVITAMGMEIIVRTFPLEVSLNSRQIDWHFERLILRSITLFHSNECGIDPPIVAMISEDDKERCEEKTLSNRSDRQAQRSASSA